MENYIRDRLDNQIEWYDKKAISTQRWYKWLKLLEVLLTASIPVLNYFAPDTWPIRGISIVIGFFLTVLMGIHHIWNYQEKWTSYRLTCELLQQEKFLAINAAGPYTETANVKQLLVERCETIMQNENHIWNATVSQDSSSTAS